MTAYIFPDSQVALMELLAPFGETTSWLDYSFAGRVAPGHAIIHIEDGEGDERGMFRTDEFSVAVYAIGRTEANRIAESIRAHLTGGVAWETSAGLLDTIEVRRVPYSAPYAHDQINKVSAVYMVDTRPVFT